MQVMHLQWVAQGKIALLLILASVRLLPHIISDHNFRATLRPLYDSTIVTTQPAQPAPNPCANLDMKRVDELTPQQRLTVGTLLVSLCIDSADQVLPEQIASQGRWPLLIYQRGLIAWKQGETRRAATIWRQGQGIDGLLLIRARHLRETDIDEAQLWYEAAIMSASSPQMVAESITAYSEELRGRVPSETFRKRLAYLASYFGEDTAVGYRLLGEHALRGGSYQRAFELLSQAISSGIADAETWYLLGDAAWKLNDLLTTEQAYRAALNAPIQIAWRRPWHLNRLAALLSTQGRLDEAILFQEEAVRLSNYYAYTDNLAVLYAEFGQSAKAEAFCTRARSLAGSMETTLRCEER